MRDWLLHMTEAQRTYAVGLIDAVLDRLGTPFDLPPARGHNRTRLTVQGLADRRPGARVAFSKGQVFLRTPLSLRRDRFAAEITGPACAPIDVLADGDVAAILVTLAGWRSALSSPVTSETTADVDEMERAAKSLLRGIVHMHRPDWEMAALQSSRDDGHVVRVFSREPDGSQLGRRFTSRPNPRGGGMTRELAAEIDRLGGGRDHVHVVELERWQRYRMCFEASPDYLVSPTTDPMTTMRALNALPSGARLMSRP
jgi:hypothetical protein